MTANLSAFLSTIAHSEGTDKYPDPYRVCFGGKHTIADFFYHPHELRSDGTREWAGEPLDFLGPRYVGEISSAAGRYQINLPTWLRLKSILRLSTFGPDSQDDVAIQLIKERGALELANSGRVVEALSWCSPIWASLPGSTSGQPQAEIADLIHTYMDNGGALV